MKKTKRILIALAVTALLIVLSIRAVILVRRTPSLSDRSTTRSYPIPFSSAEAALYDALHLKKSQVLTNTIMAQARPEGKLAKSMPMKLFAINLHDHVPGKRLSFTAKHIYNIGANGGQYIRFDLIARTPDLTEITVNYTDSWVGMWPPFIVRNSGTGREKNIHKIIWQNKLPTSDSTLSAEK